MANINISELRPAGFDLFQDSESFLSDLTDTDSRSVQGGAGEEYLASQQYHEFVEATIITFVVHHLSELATSFSYEYKSSK